ncbi:MAG: sulfotransferase domain-containing protein [Myxococcota bacterium]
MGDGRLPDFIIIGAAKSGTTSLHDYLARHPQICLSASDDPAVRDKEPCFFDPDVNGSRGLDWYRALFSAARADQVCGEASTNYTRHPQVAGVPERIAATVPNVRLLYLMRDPVERAYSHYVHRWSRELHPDEPFRESFREFVAHDPMCLDSSDYELQIRRYWDHFPREALLLLRMDDLLGDPAALLRRVCGFIGVDPDCDLLAAGPVASNPGGVSEKKLRYRFTKPLRHIPGAESLGRRVPKAWRDRAYGLLRGSGLGERVREAYQPAPLSEEDRRRLADRFRDSNRFLREECGIDTDSWGS